MFAPPMRLAELRTGLVRSPARFHLCRFAFVCVAIAGALCYITVMNGLDSSLQHDIAHGTQLESNNATAFPQLTRGGHASTEIVDAVDRLWNEYYERSNRMRPRDSQFSGFSPFQLCRSMPAYAFASAANFVHILSHGAAAAESTKKLHMIALGGYVCCSGVHHEQAIT